MEDVCRICRAEATDEEPLFHPCKCSGSIRYVHEDCLMEWLKHAQKNSQCELCRTKFKFQKQYRKSMPARLPLWTFVVYFGGKAMLVFRGLFLLSVLSIFSKIGLELATTIIYQSWKGKSWLSSSVRVLTERIELGRQPVMPFLAVDFKGNIWAQELYVATLDGLLVLVAFFGVMFLQLLFAVWVFSDDSLNHDLEHIDVGELGHIDHGDYDNEEDLEGANGDEHQDQPENQRNVPEHVGVDGENVEGPAFNRMEEANGNADDRRNLVDQLVGNDQLDNMREGDHRNHDRREQQRQAILGDAARNLANANVANVQNEGALPQNAWLQAIEGNDDEADDRGVWDFARILIEGTTLQLLHRFVALVGLLSVLFEVVYQLPLFFGYWQVNSLGLCLQFLLRKLNFDDIAAKIPVGALPSSVYMNLALILIAVNTIMGVTRTLELIFMKKLLRHKIGRAFVSHFLQAFVFYKAIVIVFTELVIFPEFCGLLLHISLLPILPSGSLQFARDHINILLALQFLGGFAYMHTLNQFVSAARTFFRSGTLYFAQDPNDPGFEPMHTIITHPFPLQLRRIGISGVIYGVLILFGVGGAMAAVSRLLPFLIPLRIDYWPGWDLLRLWPLWLPVSLLIDKRYITAAALHHWWIHAIWYPPIKAAAQFLDLDSWLFGITKDLTESNPKVNRKGTFLRAPHLDNLTPRRNLRIFVPVDEHDKRLDGGEGVRPNEIRDYIVVWRPQYFWLRLGALFIVIWAVATNMVIPFTLTPLLIGRLVDQFVLGGAIKNDLIVYLVGLALWIPIWAKRFLHPRNQGPDGNRDGNNARAPEAKQKGNPILRLSGTVLLALLRYHLLMRGYSATSSNSMINFLIVQSELAFGNPMLLKVSFQIMSWIQLLMPPTSTAIQTHYSIVGKLVGVFFFGLQYGYVLFQVQRILPLGQWLKICSSAVRDRFYLEGKRLHNFGE